MISQTALNTGSRAAGTLSMPKPISFDFDEMVKAKAKADAEFAALAERHANGKFSGIGEGAYHGLSAGTDALSDAVGHEYIYDYALAAELTALTEQKRKKNGR